MRTSIAVTVAVAIQKARNRQLGFAAEPSRCSSVSLGLAMACAVLSCTYMTIEGMIDKHAGDVAAATKEFEDLVQQGFVEVHAGVTFVLINRKCQSREVKEEVVNRPASFEGRHG